MTDQQIGELLNLTEQEITTYNKVANIFKNTDVLYVCKEECIVNWFGRIMLVDEIISQSDYDNVQDFNKHCWRKLPMVEIIEKYRNKQL